MEPLNFTALSNLFKKETNIDAVYLFGSLATGKTNRNSDIDLALVLRNSSFTEKKKLNLLTEISRPGFDHPSFFQNHYGSTLISCRI